MASSRKISRTGNDEFQGESWNGFVDLCAMEDADALTSVQRKAHFAFWYMSEVCNGGHFQYFVNKDYFNHSEVLEALKEIGAQYCASILTKAIPFFEATETKSPATVVEYVIAESEAAMEGLDREYFEHGEAEIMQCMERYFKLNEKEFIEWVD